MPTKARVVAAIEAARALALALPADVVQPPPPPPPVDPPPPPVTGGTILLEDSTSGVSATYLNHQLRCGWKGDPGWKPGAFDFAKAAGAKLGAKSLSTYPTGTVVTIPLTATPGDGIIFKVGSTTSGAFATVHSRETATPPRLDVAYQDGTTGVLACLADANVNAGNAEPKAETRLVLGTSLLRFAQPTKPVASCALVCTILSGGGGVVPLEVYAFVSPMVASDGVVLRGLRASTPLPPDNEPQASGPWIIANRLTVPGWQRKWFTPTSGSQIPPTDALTAQLTTNVDLETGEALGRNCWVVEQRPSNPPTPVGFGSSPKFYFRDWPGLCQPGREDIDECHFQYRIRLGLGWRDGHSQAGKLPGMAGNDTVLQGTSIMANGRNGWNERGSFGPPLAADSPYSVANCGGLLFGYYDYSPRQQATYTVDGKTLTGFGTFNGIHDEWNHFAGGHGVVGMIGIGSDYWIDQYIRLNTPGKADGVFEARVDGVLAFRRTDFYWRDVPPYDSRLPANTRLGIDFLWMAHFSGGDPTKPLPKKRLLTYFSDWTAARSYIGPP